ncbi:hypothetical protein AGMMS4957_19030 [Bacteroidia bacterium]|nr:hypothetical protein AGMMS4957_19030 [Bacteroidia bacterium]
MTDMKDIDEKNPFTVPEGYFDGLTAQIMAQLPARQVDVAVRRTLWQHMEPYMYMAAMFAGISLIINVFVTTPEPLNLTSAADIEDFYQYYEEHLASSIYHDAVFVDDMF